MNEMKRITIRLPGWVKDEMDRQSEINWSQKIRDELIKYIKKDDIPIELTQVIRKLKATKRWDLLKVMFLYAEIYEKIGQPFKTNLSIMFGEKAKEIESEINRIFENLGIKDRSDRVYQDRNFSDVLRDVIFEEGIIDDLEDDLFHSFQSVDNKERYAKALWHLSLYFQEKIDNTYVRFEGKEMELLFSHIFEQPEEILRDLNRWGIIFYNYYDSNAYSHTNFDVPIYSYKLIRSIQENPYNYSLYDRGNIKGSIESVLSDKQNRDFLKWIKKDYEKNFYEENIIQPFKKQFDSLYGEKAFDNTLNELVNKGLLICRYWPHRKRAGRRSSMSSHLFYNLSLLGKKYLSEIVFEKLKVTENKGEIESLIEIYEN